jgi:hypothetical protein
MERIVTISGTFMIIESVSAGSPAGDLYVKIGHVTNIPRVGETVEFRKRVYTVGAVLWSFDEKCTTCGDIHECATVRVR